MMSNLGFRLMAHIGMPVRNLFTPPKRMLSNVTIRPGDSILDYGCGPGTFTLVAAERVGPTGAVAAADIHPSATKMVDQQARRRGLGNVTTILTDCDTGLPDGSIDSVIFFDVYHTLEQPERVLAELHRVLKPGGVLYFSDHHMQEDSLLGSVQRGGLFERIGQENLAYWFAKQDPNELSG